MTTQTAGLALLGLVLLAGCAGLQPRVAEQRPQARAVITAEQLADVVATTTTAYEVVRTLQPEWLRKRAARSTMPSVQDRWEGDVQVYLDGHRMGGPENLYHISADAVRQVRYLNAAEAVRYGMNHQYGAIFVDTR